jgi:hypothetical protein
MDICALPVLRLAVLAYRKLGTAASWRLFQSRQCPVLVDYCPWLSGPAASGLIDPLSFATLSATG